MIAFLDMVEADYRALIEREPDYEPLLDEMLEAIAWTRDAVEDEDQARVVRGLQWMVGLLLWDRDLPQDMAAYRARTARIRKARLRAAALATVAGPSQRGAMLKAAVKKLGPRASKAAVKRYAERLRGRARRAK